ncbi:hypothetical protein Tco_1418743 [Tanacetum coccineum]
MDKQYRQEDIQELMSKLLEDVRNTSEEFSEYINCPSWNRPLFYFDDDDDEYTVIWRRPKAITPDEPSEEPEDPLIMGEKELSTIPEKDKSSVEDLDPIPSGSKGVSNNICDNDHSDQNLSFKNSDHVSMSRFIFDNASLPRPPPEPPDVENLELEFNNFDVLNNNEPFDPGEGMDKTKITRKSSKTGKHGHENGRAQKKPGNQAKVKKSKLSVNYGSTKVKH